MAKNVSKTVIRKDPANLSEKPKKLSKAGEWRKAHPRGICEILDMRAVLK
ncbi:MAG: hypothetical protein LBB74_09535 [Chitinispirillales bacterium]|jgi:hypothetical protein|nr:hypothetical protein [Chitinispirillales bacterium]